MESKSKTFNKPSDVILLHQPKIIQRLAQIYKWIEKDVEQHTTGFSYTCILTFILEI